MLMLILLTTNWGQLLPQLIWLWLISWGVRALLVGLLLGSLFWLYRRLR